jgi:hypothetical protein
MFLCVQKMQSGLTLIVALFAIRIHRFFTTGIITGK